MNCFVAMVVFMKKILLKYYSRKNLGDDLFVKIFTDYFNEYYIYLITNPRYTPKKLGKNVKVHPFSFLYTLTGKVMSLLGNQNKVSSIMQSFLEYCLNRIENKIDAVVYIGGSIFMDKVRGDSPLDFGIKGSVDYNVSSSLQKDGKRFVIGANLGPAHSEHYWEGIKTLLKKYKHVCLRDYSSYNMVKELSHVQYAPDVIFLTDYSGICRNEENVVISVINVSQYTTDQNVISAYYNLLEEVIIYFSSNEIKVVLTSFCEREGDGIGIRELLNRVASSYVTTCYYDGDMDKILSLFANSSFVIASRFHSFILAVLFGKPVFPIAYNCKTENYLYDLNFSGRYVNLNDITTLTLDDILFNYNNHIITDCTNHKRYAVNQFWGLRTYLEERKAG